MAEEIISKEMKRILVCDDDTSVVSFLTLFLKKEGFGEVDVASCGKEALEKIRNVVYHLVLLNIRLPDMDGIQALQRIKEINSKIDVIMITGYPEMETAQQSVKLGAYDYIVKPFDLAYMKLAVMTKLLLGA